MCTALDPVSICLAIVAVIAVGFAFNARIQENDARALVQTLLGVKTPNVTDLVGVIDEYRQWAVPLLRNVVDGEGSTRKQKLHASLALLAYDPSQADYLLDQLLSAEVDEVPVIITLLEPQKSRIQQRLWEAVKKGTSTARLRAAAALAVMTWRMPNGKRSDRTLSRLWCRCLRQNPALGSACCDPSAPACRAA